MSRIGSLVAACLIGAAVVAPGLGWGETAEGVVVPELSPAAASGLAAYTKHCAGCHGVDTAGTDEGPTFLHRVYHPGHHADASIVLAAKRGARAHHWRFGDMEPVPDVSDTELADIVRYIREMQKANGIF